MTDDPGNDDGELEKSSIESSLAKLGLNGLQASTYLSLLQSGASTARSIAQKIHVNRTDVYRIIRTLSTRGLVNTIMQNPNSYEAVRPEVAIKILISEMEDQVMAAKRETPDVVMQLNSIRRTIEVHEKKSPAKTFKLMTGKLVITAWKDLLYLAKREVLRVWSPEGIRMNYSQGLIDDFRECVSRRVKVRGIAEINRKNVFECEEFASVIELRHLDDLSEVVRYEIIDDSDIIISSMDFKINESKLEGIATNNKVLVNGFKKDFEEMWCKAIPARTRIAEIQKLETKRLSV